MGGGYFQGACTGGFQRSYSKNSFWSFICNVSTIFWAVKTRKVGLTPTPTYGYWLIFWLQTFCHTRCFACFRFVVSRCVLTLCFCSVFASSQANPSESDARIASNKHSRRNGRIIVHLRTRKTQIYGDKTLLLFGVLNSLFSELAALSPRCDSSISLNAPVPESAAAALPYAAIKPVLGTSQRQTQHPDCCCKDSSLRCPRYVRALVAASVSVVRRTVLRWRHADVADVTDVTRRLRLKTTHKFMNE